MVQKHVTQQNVTKNDFIKNYYQINLIELSGFEPTGLSHVGSYAGELPQSATKAKNDKRIEGRIVGMGRFTPGTHQQGSQKLYKETQSMCGNWWWTH